MTRPWITDQRAYSWEEGEVRAALKEHGKYIVDLVPLSPDYFSWGFHLRYLQTKLKLIEEGIIDKFEVDPALVCMKDLENPVPDRLIPLKEAKP